MGILTRFKDIMSANVNALLDKAEDPAKMIDQTLLNLRKDLAEVKKETAAVMADEKNAKRKVTECEKHIADYKAAAESALRAGNEGDARTLLEAKKKEEEKLAALQKTYDMTAANADNMQAMHDKLVRDIENLESKRDSIKAKMATAKAQKHMNQVLSGGDKAAASIDAFERYEAKADKMLDEAAAMTELNKTADDNTADSLLDKYKNGGNADVDDELERMKKELGCKITAVGLRIWKYDACRWISAGCFCVK